MKILFVLFLPFLLLPAVGNLAKNISAAESRPEPKVLGVSVGPPESPPSTGAGLPLAALASPTRAPEIPRPRKIPGAERLFLPEARAAVVIDVASGEILYDQNAAKALPIASLTKIYTAYLLRRAGISPEEKVVLREEDLRTVGSRVGCRDSLTCSGSRFRPGEVVRVRDLLAAMLISSANDAARAAARTVTGDYGEFVDLMNSHAVEMGFENTSFCSPSGLEPEGSTEEDCLAGAEIIARVAAKTLDDDLIWRFLRMPKGEIVSADGKYTHRLEATNRFAEAGDFPEMIGAKTGFPPRAGHSLLLAAREPKSGAEVVAVILGDPWRWRDMKKLIRWTFDSYRWETVESNKGKLSAR